MKQINIFYLDNNVYKCAMMHNDKHVVKMILEYSQLLSTAHRFLDGKETFDKSKTGRNVKRWILEDKFLNDRLYSATHINHPSAVWVRQSKENYIWLSNMLISLCEEYTYRYNKTHKVERDELCFVLLKNIPKNIGNKGWSEPTPAMPDNVKIQGNSIESYRNYYINNKLHLAKWKNREIPKWFQFGCLSELASESQKLGLYNADLRIL